MLVKASGSPWHTLLTPASPFPIFEDFSLLYIFIILHVGAGMEESLKRKDKSCHHLPKNTNVAFPLLLLLFPSYFPPPSSLAHTCPFSYHWGTDHLSIVQLVLVRANWLAAEGGGVLKCVCLYVGFFLCVCLAEEATPPLSWFQSSEL